LIFQCLHQWVYGTGHPRATGVKPAWEAIVVVRKPRPGEPRRQIRVTRIDPLPTLRRLLPNLEDPAAREIAERILRDPDSDRSGLDEHPAFLGAFDHLLTSLPMSHFAGPDWWEPGEAFYVPKPSVDEQNAGLEDLPRQVVKKFGAAKTPRQNTHPTPKPVKLMRTLVTQACPAGGTVLDPFAGSGTTGMACAYEGRAFIGVERDAAYLEIATRRIAYAQRLAGQAG
jgi:site-specific DNA-methyltransferase (adenine-specific)